MARKLKAMLVVVAVGMVIYFATLAQTSVADEEQFGGITVSVEASVVRVAIEALDEIAGGSEILNLGSISADEVLRYVGEEGAEVVSAVKLAVGNDSVGEITTEENAREKEKNQEDATGEHVDREISISFQAEASVETPSKIAVKFTFKQIVAENASSASSDAEQEEEIVDTFEVSSRLALQAGRPYIAGAKKNEDVATFLILRADI